MNPGAGLRATLAVAVIGLMVGLAACGRSDRRSADQLRTENAALEVERDSLRERLDALVLADDRLAGMPDTPVRIGIPTSLTRDLIQRVMTGLADQVTIVLTDMHVNRQGTIRRLVTLGDYNLQLTVNRVSGTIKAGAPVVTFGDDKVSLSMPLAVTAGSGRATVRFVWDGRTVAGAVCGDLDVTQVVTGSVRPRAYPVKASLTLTATATDIVMTPKLPTIRINLGVRPSAASWAAFQKILDDKHGVCGFVLDRIDVLDSVRELIDRGFDVRLPTEKLKAVAIPVSIEPSMLVNGTPVALGITVGELSVTQHAIWLGAHVSVAVGNAAVR